MEKQEYAPGVCNINAHGKKVRAITGIVFLALSAALWLVAAALQFDRAIRLALFFPLAGGFLGIYQALFGFCVFNAKTRVYSTENKNGEPDGFGRVLKKKFIGADDAAANKIILLTVASAAITAIITAMLP